MMRGPNAFGATRSTVPFESRSQSGWPRHGTLSSLTCARAGAAASRAPTAASMADRCFMTDPP
ncbi:MAG: hypothetical protein DMF81_20430 [Acidobacteria bacterium]|nr:MAG: hypothetical protein DMF81_20430 [Acidobacteriota bacterium]